MDSHRAETSLLAKSQHKNEGVTRINRRRVATVMDRQINVIRIMMGFVVLMGVVVKESIQ